MLVSGCLESMCHKFNSQGLGLKILELMIASPKPGGFNSRIPLRSQVPGFGSQVTRSRVSGSWVSWSQGAGSKGPRVSGLRVPGLESQVLILDYASFKLRVD